MALGFLVRRCASRMSRKTGNVLVVRYTSALSFSRANPTSPHPPPFPALLHGSSQRQDLVGGVKLSTLVRHLFSTAERAEVRPDYQRAECGPGGYRDDPWGGRRGQNPYGDGPGCSQQNLNSFHGGNSGEGSWNNPDAPIYGTGGRLELSPDEYRMRASLGQGLDGRRRSEHLPEDCSDAQWNSSGYLGSGQSDQGVGGFPQSFQGEVHQNTNGNNNARPTDQSSEVGGSSCYEGTLEELDNLLVEGKVKEAVQVLGLLETRETALDFPRYLKLLDACGDAKAVDEARVVHDYILRTMGNHGVKIYNRILDMYCRCGSTDDAYKWFDKMPERNFTSWDTMMTGLADNGLGENAIDLFNSFLQMGLKPDALMFVAVFHVCSVLGAVDEGMLHFKSMSTVYGINPTMEHYVSLVSMLGETGYLDEAIEFIEKMPIEPSVDVWETLMNRCRLQGNVELGDRCAEIVNILDPSRLTDQSMTGLLPIKASDLAKEKQKKSNLLEVRSRVHEYRAGDTSHPEKDRIYGLIRGLAATLRESGYVPDTRFVLHDIDQESKEEALLAHSERLATAYGLISSSARSSIRIIKNLRICGDCHSYMKIVSKLVGRELIIRDAKRFHHFKDGLCSCKDYW